MHIVAGLAVANTVGNGFTVTLTVAVPVHPVLVVPVTVYVVVLVGETVLLDPVPKLCDQLYVFAPLALNVVLEPEHIEEGDADAIRVGVGLTFTVTVAVAEQTPLVPVTE